MVKRKSSLRGLHLRGAAKSAKTGPKDASEDISSAPMPPSRLRKCVVKIKRIRDLPLRDVGADRSAKTAPKDASEDISSAPMPPSRLRKCVVKIKRIILPESPESRELYLAAEHEDNSAFEPVRNSTMYVPQKVARKLKPPPTKRRVPGPKVISPRPKKISPTKPVPQDSSTKKGRFFNREQLPLRSRSSVTRNVYEFLSQTQIEDDNNREDPAADIIQRLVENGKACVMIPSKAGGKLIMKPIKRKRRRPVGKRKTCSIENVAGETAKTESKKNPRPPRQRETARALSPIYEPEEDSINDEVEVYPSPITVDVQVHAPPNPSVHSNASKQASDGAYSHLARSVLLNQTKSQDDQQSSSRRRNLLNMARQLVSTPLNRRTVTAPNANSTTHAISPILRNSANATASMVGGASPWRVSDESAMPNTFIFGFNTSQLPSYSSDHMRRPHHVYVPDKPTQEPAEPINKEETFCNTLQEPTSPIADNSNEENRPPPTANRTLISNEQENVDNGENAENFVHLPNPRKTLQKRTPFQDINIMEVVVLPSWKKNVQVTPAKVNTATKVATASPAQQRSQTRANLFGYDEILPCEDQPRNSTQSSVSSCRNLFGFEEFLTENEMVAPAGSSTLSQIESLPNKLHRLGELRPRNNELPQVSSDLLRQNCFGEARLGQCDIRQVMCSTMIAPKEPAIRRAPQAVDKTMGLFRDVNAELETTFDKKKPRRTYVKERPKRKRKQRVHVLYIDTDSSEEESEQDSKGNSMDSPQKKQQLKRPRKDVEHEAKLQEFITGFNKECEEVEKFPIVIE